MSSDEEEDLPQVGLLTLAEISTKSLVEDLCSSWLLGGELDIDRLNRLPYKALRSVFRELIVRDLSLAVMVLRRCPGLRRFKDDLILPLKAILSTDDEASTYSNPFVVERIVQQLTRALAKGYREGLFVNPLSPFDITLQWYSTYVADTNPYDLNPAVLSIIDTLDAILGGEKVSLDECNRYVRWIFDNECTIVPSASDIVGIFFRHSTLGPILRESRVPATSTLEEVAAVISRAHDLGRIHDITVRVGTIGRPPTPANLTRFKFPSASSVSRPRITRLDFRMLRGENVPLPVWFDSIKGLDELDFTVSMTRSLRICKILFRLARSVKSCRIDATEFDYIDHLLDVDPLWAFLERVRPLRVCLIGLNYRHLLQLSPVITRLELERPVGLEKVDYLRREHCNSAVTDLSIATDQLSNVLAALNFDALQTLSVSTLRGFNHKLDGVVLDAANGFDILPGEDDFLSALFTRSEGLAALMIAKSLRASNDTLTVLDLSGVMGVSASILISALALYMAEYAPPQLHTIRVSEARLRGAHFRPNRPPLSGFDMSVIEKTGSTVYEFRRSVNDRFSSITETLRL